jgi:hypothetical protein
MDITSALRVFALGLFIGFAIGAAVYFALRLVRKRNASRNCARWMEYLELVEGKARRDAQALVTDLANVNRLPRMTSGKVSEILAHRKG